MTEGMLNWGQRANTIGSVLISPTRRDFISVDLSVAFVISALYILYLLRHTFYPMHTYRRRHLVAHQDDVYPVPRDTQVNTTVKFVELEGNRIGHNGGEVCELLPSIASEGTYLCQYYRR